MSARTTGATSCVQPSLPLLDAQDNNRVHDAGPRMRLEQDVVAQGTQLLRELENLVRVSPGCGGGRARDEVTGYSRVRRPRALLATTRVPGGRRVASEARTASLDWASRPTRAARKTTSDRVQGAAGASRRAPTSSHVKAMRTAWPRLVARRREACTAAASRSTLCTRACGKASSRQKDVSGSGPEPRKAMVRGGAGRKVASSEDSRRARAR